MTQENSPHHVATFAGGCFWCTTSAFSGLKGVISIESGYTGGQEENPTYEQVCSGNTGHYEAVRIIFDPDLISYTRLLQIFFGQLDPTDPDGSFADRGPQYRSAVFFHDKDQQQAALSVIEKINASRLFNRPVATKVIEATPFYPAETYHQDYPKKNPERYAYYRAASGRGPFVDQYQARISSILAPETKDDTMP